MFAIKESVQESLGFSIFELVFGHTLRGPLKLLKEKFLSNDDSSLNLLQYVSDFKDRLSKACEAARTNLKVSRKVKRWYDENANERLEKVSIGHGCPRQNAIQKKVTYVVKGW